MAVDAMDAKQRWAIAACGATAVAALVVFIFRGPAIPVLQQSSVEKAVRLKNVTADRSALGEETVMRDLTPLFLPTERNASLAKLPMREPGKSFLELDAPRVGIADAGWRFDAGLPPLATLNGKPPSKVTPLELLEETAQSAPLHGFGREAEPMAAMIPRGGFVEVVNARNGERLVAEVLPLEARPPTDKVWQPLEFIAAVGPAGLVTPLTVATRSGVEEVDVYFRNFLARTFRVGELLPPGYYRISVAP